MCFLQKLDCVANIILVELKFIKTKDLQVLKNLAALKSLRFLSYELFKL